MPELPHYVRSSLEVFFTGCTVMCASAAYALPLSGDAPPLVVREGIMGIAAELSSLVNDMARVVTA